MSMAVILATLSAFQRAEKEAVELRWKLQPDQFARYKVSRVVTEDGRERMEEFRGRPAGLFGHEIANERLYVAPPLDWTEIPLILGFSLPERPLKIGGSTGLSLTLDNGYQVAPIEAAGTATRREDVTVDEAPCVEVGLELALAPHSRLRPTGDQRRVKTGRFDGVVTFDPELGAVKRLRFDFSLTFEGGETVTRSEQFDLVSVRASRYDGFKGDVNAAIRLAEEWLRGKQLEDGSWEAYQKFKSGPTALALLTLLKGNPKRDDAALARALDWLVEQPFEYVYEVSLSMMAVEEYYARPEDKEDVSAGRRREADLTRTLPQAHLEWMREATTWMDAAFREGGWAYGRAAERVDLSNTQYAMLGLQAAARCGVGVDERLVRDAMRTYVTWQQRKGPATPLSLRTEAQTKNGKAPSVKADARGWGYSGNPDDIDEAATLSMTAGGVSSLTIGMSLLQRSRVRLGSSERTRFETAIRDGWAWIGRRYSVKANAATGRHNLYYSLYALERASSLNGIAAIDGRDWYAEGAAYLVANQAPDGTWYTGPWVVPCDVCFAVLFLKRTTIRVDTVGG